jgi:hypothetical protein
LPIDPHVQEYHDALETLQAGDTVFCSFSIGPGYIVSGEAGSEWIAWFELAMENDLNLIIGSFGDGSGYYGFTWWYDNFAIPRGYDDLYGERFVYLGFFSGQETALAGVLEDLHKGGEDYLGTPLSQLPVMQGVKSANDLQAGYHTSCCWPAMWIRQLTAYSHLKVFITTGRQYITDILPYYSAGLTNGYLSGQRDIAMFESLTQRPYAATKFMDSQSTTHIVLIGTLIATNIILWMYKSQGGES